jgi:alanyl-tRNA synthetase
MGLERIAAVLQGVHDNYDIDLFRKLIAASEAVTGVAAAGEERASHKVIADHLRATGFLIADGVLPSNEGRGYVLRRIMRRAMRHANMLGARDPVLWRLVPTLVEAMGRPFPELRRAEEMIASTVRSEEERFQKTLSRGLALLNQATETLHAGDRLDGETAFRLYDTYGFPLDLTQDALRPRGIAVDEAGFAAAMERQKAEARAAWAGSGEASQDTLWFALRDRVGATEFLGYDADEAEGVVLALVAGGIEVERLGAGEEGAIVVSQTPFYGEAGGQVGDTGVIAGDGWRFRVADTKKFADGLIVHLGTMEEGEAATGDDARLAIDRERRTAIRANHSGTHLLHEALRRVLGTHVAQKGSLVAPDRLRFDFSHPQPIGADQIATIEAMANRAVRSNDPVTTRIMAVDEAIESGAMALFGEKYGDEVRVVSMGRNLDGAGGGAGSGSGGGGRGEQAAGNRPFSIELCGGTHVERTGDIGLLTVVAEGAVSSGVRRVEALTGEAARAHLAEQDRRLRDVAEGLRVPPAEVVVRAKILAEEKRMLER